MATTHPGHTSRIVTHQAAYDTRVRLDICTACEAAGVATVKGFPLGPVDHGEHRGECQVTAADLRAAGISALVV